ncbi:MAG: hypothetical protein K2Y28_01365 [Burkholderiaceae bacterium]|nr:hypothetical protein [Burkholderiaceae bacterium]
MNQISTFVSPTVFNFNSLDIHVVADERGEPLFMANDVCAILGYTNAHAAISKHCKFNGVTKREVIDSMGRSQEANFINEGNLYRLIIKSRKPEAEAFEVKVMEEILPAIRKTGEYRAPYAVNPTDTLTAAQAEELRLALKQRCDLLPKASQAAFMIKGWSRLKAHFGVSYRQIPQSEFTEALSLVTRHASEWELLDSPEVPVIAEKKYNFPKELLLQKHFCPKDESGNLLLPKLDLRTFANEKFISPIKALLTEMHADGHNVDAAYAEFAAMQFGIKALDDQLSMLSMIGTGAGNSALKILFRK